ncbi:MAG TPA: efflux RND transporter periplasmic adaptor subunit [Fimbriimonadaceae bacterium]|nr:efflux RND transporter periplasmic adaptor subunit [Fimbriimonadaceae bacterium]
MKGSFVLVSVVAALGVVGCVDRDAQKQAARTAQIVADPTKPVSVATVSSRTLSETVEISGQVATSSDVAVGAKSAGRIVSVYVRDGDPVRTGQVIAVQDTSSQMASIRQAQAQVNSARAALAQARANATIGPSRSTAALRSAEAQLRAARAQLQKVRAGARAEERAQAETNVNAARSNMETARRDAERSRELFSAGAISRQQLERSENAYQAALAQYENAIQGERLTRNASRPEDISAAEEAVRQAEEGVRSARANKELDVLLGSQVDSARAAVSSAEAQLTIARQALEDAQVRAPFAGRISGQPVQPGTVLGPGGVVARIIGPEGTFFEGEVPEGVIARLRMGSPVSVRVQALGEGSLSGRIAAISPSASNVGRLFRVRVQLSGAEGVRPGMFATGMVQLRQIPGAIVVPSTAIIRRPDETFVYVVEANKAKRVNVVVGLTQGEWTQVQGVSTGQLVVTAGQQALSDGALIKVEETAKLSASLDKS